MRVGRTLRNYSSLHADHRRILRGMVLGAIFVLVGRLAGAGKEMAIAWRFGTGSVVDAYQLAATMVWWLPTVVASVASTLLVTVLVRSRRDSTANRIRLLGELNGFAVVLGLLATSVGLLLAGHAVELLAAGLSLETRQLATEMSRQLAPAGLIAIFVTLFAVRLQAGERHVNTLLDALPAFVLVTLLLAWPAGASSAPLILGTLLGTAVHMAVLARLGTRADGAFGGVRFGMRSQYWDDIRRAAPALVIGQFALSFVGPVDQFTAAKYGDSAIATLGYANRVIALLVSLGALTISRASLPVFTDAVNAHELSEARRRAFGWAWLMFAVGTIAAGLSWWLMPWGIKVLFERGAFTAEDTALVAYIARFGALQLPFYFGGIVMVQFLAASGWFGAIAASAVMNLIVKVALNLVAVKWSGLEGIMLATTGMYAASFAFLMIVSSRVRR